MRSRLHALEESRSRNSTVDHSVSGKSAHRTDAARRARRAATAELRATVCQMMDRLIARVLADRSGRLIALSDRAP